MINYKIIRHSTKLDKETLEKGIRQGFKLWEDVTQLSFKQVKNDDDSFDISVEFSDDHENFLKYATISAEAIGNARIVLNDRCHWTLDGARNMIQKDGLRIPVFTRNLPVIVAHEFGHLRGMVHSSDPKSIMKSGNPAVKRPSANDIRAMNEVLCA